MGSKRKTFLLVLMVCSSQCSPARSSQPCASFIFETLTNNTLTAAINTPISFPFQLQQHNCTAQNFTLVVAKRNSNTGRLGYHCKILHIDGKCDPLSQQSWCRCQREPGQYNFSKTAELTDSGTWVWKIEKEGHAEEATVTFQITSPPIFELTNHTFSCAAARNKEATFPVRMHTKDIISCQLTRNTSENNHHETPSERSMDCLSLMTVTGCPPDLIVKIRLNNLNNVRTQDQETWRLTLTNDVGSGQVDVFLHVPDDRTLQIRSTPGHPTEPSLASWVMAGSAVVAAVAVVVYVVILACSRHRQEGTKHRLPASRRAVNYSYMRSSFESLPYDLLASRHLPRSEECVMIDNVLYQRSASLLKIPEKDAGCSGLSKFNINNRPPAQLPSELYGQEEGDYSEVGESPTEAKDTVFTADEHGYIPIKDILERK